MNKIGMFLGIAGLMGIMTVGSAVDSLRLVTFFEGMAVSILMLAAGCMLSKEK